MANSAKISPSMAINIRSNFVTRLRSIGMARSEIERLDWWLTAACDDCNDIADMDRRYKRQTRTDVSFSL